MDQPKHQETFAPYDVTKLEYWVDEFSPRLEDIQQIANPC